MENQHLTQYSLDAVQTIIYLSQGTPLIVALDGGSGAGKSTLAAAIKNRLDTSVIHCDAFFNAAVPDEGWPTYSLSERCRQCFDWERLYQEALFAIVKRAESREPFIFFFYQQWSCITLYYG